MTNIEKAMRYINTSYSARSRKFDRTDTVEVIKALLAWIHGTLVNLIPKSKWPESRADIMARGNAYGKAEDHEKALETFLELAQACYNLIPRACR